MMYKDDRGLRNTVAAIWNLLPKKLRQKGFGTMAAALRPALSRPAPELVADRAVPRIVIGVFSSTTGLGQSARLTASALRREGYRVLGVDVASFFYESGVKLECPVEDVRGHRGPAHIIAVVNAPYLSYVFARLGAGFLSAKHITGYWAWELPSVPPSWGKGCACVHDIAVPSQFTATAVRDLAAATKVRVAPHPAVLDAPPPRPAGRERKSGMPFTAITTANVGSGFARKNPIAAIRAFRMAFADRPECRLRMLVTGVEQYPAARELINAEAEGCSTVEVCWESLDRRAFFQWWGTPDVYLSLHRSEGFGLPLAEAMSAGCPVIATGWSGNLEFMRSDNSFLVEYQLVDVEDPQGKYAPQQGRWAEPDIGHAADLLRAAERDPQRTRAVGLKAAEAVREHLNARAFTKALLS